MFGRSLSFVLSCCLHLRYLLSSREAVGLASSFFILTSSHPLKAPEARSRSESGVVLLVRPSG